MLSASIVGSGELIATTTLGAEVGFAALWVILLSCVVKVALQLEFGRHAIIHGLTTMESMNQLPDLGIDQIVAYRFDDSTGSLRHLPEYDVNTPRGSGPRHFVFSPSGEWAFLSLELTSEVASYSYRDGIHTEVGRWSTIPADSEEMNTCAEIRVSADGKNVYVSNRGHESLAIFDVDSSSGVLDRKQIVSTEGLIPRNFGISPDDRWLVVANQDSHTLVCFRRDLFNGTLVKEQMKRDCLSPALICFFPAE